MEETYPTLDSPEVDAEMEFVVQDIYWYKYLEKLRSRIVEKQKWNCNSGPAKS